MSSTTGNPYYQIRSMNGYYNVVDGNGNSLDAVAQKVTNISYDANTDTTTIIENTTLQTVNVDSITFPDGSSISTAPAGFGTDVSFGRVDISLNLTTPQITFWDGSVQTTAYLGGGGGYPVDASFSYIDVSNNITTKRLTFNDGTYLETALDPYQLPADVSFNSLYANDISGVNIHATNDVIADNYIIGGNLFTNGEIVNTSYTATNAIGFPYSNSVYSFQYITGQPEIGDFVAPTQSNMPTGIESNFFVSSFDMSGTLTFNSSQMSNIAQLYETVNSYAPKTNEIWSYDMTAGLISLGSGIESSGITSPIQPFVNAYTAYGGAYFVATPLNTLTLSPKIVVSGYVKTPTQIVSNDTFFNGRYLTASTNLQPPTRVVSQSGKVITIQSRNTITPSVSTGTINGIPVSGTQISYTSLSGSVAVGDYLGSSQQDGITIQSIDISNSTIVVANGTLSGIPLARATIYGYVSQGNVIQTYDTTIANIYDHVQGLGVSFPNNYIISKTSTALSLKKTNATIASPVNTFSGYVDTNRVITNGSIIANLNFLTNPALPIPTRITDQTGVYVNITSPSTITNTTKTAFSAVSFNDNKLAYQSASPVVGYFVSSSNGVYDVSDGTIMSIVDTTASQQIITISTTVKNNVQQFQNYGYIPANNKICLTSNANVLVNRYLYDPSGITIPFGRNYVSYFDGSGCLIYNNTLTPTASAGTFYGYLKMGGSTSAILITNDSFATGSQIQFITGAGFSGTGYNGSSNTGVIRNLTCAGTNTSTATSSTTFQGFVWDTATISYVSVSGSGIGAFYQSSTLIAEGTEQQSSTDTTNQLLPVKTGMTVQSSPDFTRIGYALSTNTIQLYDTTSIVANQFIRSSYTTSNKPYITGVNTSTKVLTLSAGTVSSQSTIFTPTGYILNATTLILPNTVANSGAISNTTFATGTGLAQPTQITAYNSTTNQYTIQSPNTITPTTPVFTGYGVIISTVSLSKLVTNNTVARTSVCVECTPLLDYGSVGTGTNILDISYNTQSNSSTFNIITGAFYGGFLIVSPTTSVALGSLITSSSPSNPYTNCIFSGALQNTQGSGGKYATTSVALTNSTPKLSADRQWIVSSANEIAYQIGATGTPSVNDLLYASDNTYVSGSVISAISNTTYRILQCSGRTFTVPTAVATQSTLGSGTNQFRVNLSALSASVVVGMFVKIASISSSILGVKITALSRGTANWVDLDTLVSYTGGVSVSFYNGNTASSFNVLNQVSLGTYTSTTLKIYNPITVSVYANSNFNMYNPLTVSIWSPTMYTKYDSSVISITTPAVYQSIVPQNYNEITSSPYSLYDISGIQTYTPLSMEMWNSQAVNFYNPQVINLIRDNRISIPKTTDTMCVLNAVQTMQNKTINTSTLNSPVINTPTINGGRINSDTLSTRVVLNTGNYQIRATNSSGVDEDFLWARWSGDNGTYMNYGAGGLHLRNNSSANTLSMFANNFITGSKCFAGVIKDAGYVPITTPSNSESYYYLPYSSTERILIIMRHEIDAGARNITIPSTYGTYTKLPFVMTQRYNNGGNAPCTIDQNSSLGFMVFYCDTARGSTDKADFWWMSIGLTNAT